MEETSHPRRVGSFDVDCLLAIGGMGEVYRARDEEGSPVALKRLPPEACSHEVLRRRFRREAAVIRKLDHPAIVKVFDVFETAEGHWIVMEYVAGETLARLIEKQKKGLRPARVLALARQIAEGLAEAHDKGIIHRDLKTENVVAVPGGGVKILDFGLAKYLYRDESGAPLTTAGTMIGTCRSMSPEQAMGEDVDPRSDLFSLGILIYEALTGVPPFVAATPLGTARLLVSHAHRPLTEMNPRVPAELAELVDRLLRKRREQRPRSAREVIARLDAMRPPSRWRGAAAWLGSRLGLGSRSP